jgi:hypothetical protein
MKPLVLLASLFLLLAPGLVRAEVSDKIATIPQLGLSAILVGSLLLLLSRAWVRAGLILLPVTALLAYAALEPTLDPYVGPAILAEQGSVYYFASYAAAAALVMLHVLGLWLGRRRQHVAA